MLGLHHVERRGDSVYLRAWGDWYRYSVVLTASDLPGLGHAAWRTEGEEELADAVARLNANGSSGDWIEPSFGHGRAYRFEGHGGQLMEIFWEVDSAIAPSVQAIMAPRFECSTTSR